VAQPLSPVIGRTKPQGDGFRAFVVPASLTQGKNQPQTNLMRVNVKTFYDVSQTGYEARHA
jgi:hypothetical protein